MNKLRKVIASVLIALLIAVVTILVSLIIILEPNIKINGFAELDKNRLNAISQTVKFLDESGAEMDGRLYDNDKIFVSLSELPSYTSQAFVAVEDKRFYTHHGVDYLRILSAAKNNVLSRSFKEGASTISQQLIKNTHLKSDKTISRKIQEIRIARELERNYDKNEILSMYLNALYFGENIYGIGNASKAFFNKSASDLSVSESALLAGIINSPSYFSPRKKYQRAITRRNLVLKRMLEQNYISKTEYEKAIKEENKIEQSSSQNNAYLDYSLSEITKETGMDEETIFKNGYKINTYCDLELQKFTESVIKDYQAKNAIISTIVARNEDSSVISCSSDASCDISNLKRSPGSTIKPILCYAPALENGGIYTCTPILDEKTSFGGWSPSNYNEEYLGWTDIETSLIKSLNIPAIKLLDHNGIEKSKRIAKSFGIRFNKNDDHLSLALGNMTDGVTLNELCSAYSVFSNEGYYSENKFVKNIVDQNGNVVFERKSDKRKAISKETAYLITDMLKKCAQKGTAKRLSYSKLEVAGKTGTVGNKNGNTDAFCIAYTPKYTVAVWMGAKNGTMENKFSGGTTPAKIAEKIISKLSDTSTFEVPSEVIYAEIDEKTRKEEHKVLLAGKDIPLLNRKKVIFNKKSMPKRYSTPSTYLENDTILDYFDNFKIVDGFVD